MITKQDILNKYKLVDGKLYFYRDPRRTTRRAGGINSAGYRIVGLLGKRYTEEKLIAIILGKNPAVRNIKSSVDDINPSVNNLSGYKGVSRDKSGRYKSILHFQGKKIYLGMYDTPEEAHHVYLLERTRKFIENNLDSS